MAVENIKITNITTETLPKENLSYLHRTETENISSAQSIYCHKTIYPDCFEKNIRNSGDSQTINKNSSLNYMPSETYTGTEDNSIVNDNSFGDDSMDKMMEKYIEKMDRDQSDLRNDIRASEERIAKSIELSETRNNDRLNKMENIINDYVLKMDNSFNKIDNRIDRLEGKIDSNNKFIISISITTILGIAALVIAVILAIGSVS